MHITVESFPDALLYSPFSPILHSWSQHHPVSHMVCRGPQAHYRLFRGVPPNDGHGVKSNFATTEAPFCYNCMFQKECSPEWSGTV